MAAFSSFIAGTISIAALMLVANPLAKVAVSFDSLNILRLYV